MQKHPKVLPIILTAEFCDQFSYWGLQSILVLYLTGALFLNNTKAYIIYGTFSALTYLFTILGGYLADKLLGFYQCLRIGVIFAIAGNLILVLGKANLLYFGLALITCGKALFMSNNASLLGTFYYQIESKRDQGFVILYTFTNLGSLFGPIGYGYMLNAWGWNSCFILSTGLYLFTQLILTIYKGQLIDKKILYHIIKSEKLKAIRLLMPLMIFFSLFLLVVISYYLLKHVEFTGILLAVFTGIILLYFINLALKKFRKQKLAIFFLLNLMIFCLIFFTFEFQIYSSLMIFVKDYVNKKFLFWNIPINDTASFESLAVILFSPIFVLIWKLSAKQESKAIFNRVIAGLFLESISFFILTGMAYQALSYPYLVSIYPLIIAYLFLGAGEVCVMPTIIAATTQYSPAALRGILMGILFFTNAISGYLDGIVSTFTVVTKTDKIAFIMQYCKVYFFIAIGILIIIIFAYFCAKYLFKFNRLEAND